MAKLTKAQLRFQLIDRWQAVHAIEVRELRRASVKQRFGELNMLANWARQAGWDSKLREENATQWNAWATLKRKWHASKEGRSGRGRNGSDSSKGGSVAA